MRPRYLAWILLFGAALPVAVCETGSAAWYDQAFLLGTYHRRYHSPHEYPGRAIYAGSRRGLYGYRRTDVGLNQPLPRSMQKVAPPTMYYYRTR